MPRRLTLEEWNRTLLERQHLLGRVDDDAVEVLDRLVGVQSQDPQAAFFGLAARVHDFDPTELDDLLADREVVRMALQRGTVHLMDALDARWLRALLQSAIDAATRRSHAGRLTSAHVDDVVAHAAELLSADERPVPASALRAHLAARFPDEPAASLVALVRGALPLVQTPPRGLWRRAGAPAYRLLADWIGPGEPAVVGEEARRDLIRLYLRGFGPSSVAAVQTWSGLTGLAPVMAAMEADWELARLVGPGGEDLFDLEGLPIIEGDRPAPVRCLAPFDAVLVANGDRVRVADPDLYAKTVTPNGLSPGFVLVDGRLAATWKRGGDGVELTALRDLSSAERSAVERETALVAAFASR